MSRKSLHASQAQSRRDTPDRQYRGKAAVDVGPLLLEFTGDAQLLDVNDDALTARIIARGADTKGRGNASATVDMRSLMPVRDVPELLLQPI